MSFHDVRFEVLQSLWCEELNFWPGLWFRTKLVIWPKLDFYPESELKWWVEVSWSELRNWKLFLTKLSLLFLKSEIRLVLGWNPNYPYAETILNICTECGFLASLTSLWLFVADQNTISIDFTVSVFLL